MRILHRTPRPTKTRISSPMRFTLILLGLLFSHSTLAGILSFSLSECPCSVALVVNIYNVSNSFGDLREPYQRHRFEIAAPDARYTLKGLPPGDYALLIYHDENRNGELDQNFVGIPREPIALSNNYLPKGPDRKSTRLNSSHVPISYAVFCFTTTSTRAVSR